LESYERALALLSSEGQHPVVADVLCGMGTVRRELGQTREAETYYHQSLEVAAWCGYLSGQARAVNCLAAIAQRRGDLKLAEGLYRRAARLASEAADHRLSGMVEQNLGVLANIRGDLDSALVHYRKSLRAFEQADDREGMTWVLNNMGMLQTDLGLYAQAEKTLQRGLKIARERGDRVMEGLCELNLGEAYIGQQDWKAARQALKRSLAIADERGDELRRAEAMKYQAVIQRERGAYEKSIAQLEEAHDLALKGEDVLLCAEILVELGEAWRQQEERTKARSTWETALEQFRGLDAQLDAAGVEARLLELGRAA
jgi:tetratricopeptide (TPR) repeat protein